MMVQKIVLKRLSPFSSKGAAETLRSCEAASLVEAGGIAFFVFQQCACWGL